MSLLTYCSLPCPPAYSAFLIVVAALTALLVIPFNAAAFLTDCVVIISVAALCVAAPHPSSIVFVAEALVFLTAVGALSVRAGM